MLQQYLPFTVLKPKIATAITFFIVEVATVLTVYGIETSDELRSLKKSFGSTLQQYLPFTVLKPIFFRIVRLEMADCCNSTYRLRY